MKANGYAAQQPRNAKCVTSRRRLASLCRSLDLSLDLSPGPALDPSRVAGWREPVPGLCCVTLAR
jgi:hypothetical protein